MVHLKKIGPQYELKIQRKIITYVKNEESILNTMIIVLKFIRKCETLSLDEMWIFVLVMFCKNKLICYN
jgi:hypothetical protein